MRLTESERNQLLTETKEAMCLLDEIILDYKLFPNIHPNTSQKIDALQNLKSLFNNSIDKLMTGKWEKVKK